MKPHEHILISLGYAAGVAFLSAKGLTDPWIYISAAVGGEIIDLVDHPLYQLVYQRNTPHVKEARQIFHAKGLKAAYQYLKVIEDTRQIKGLLLHNIYSLLAVALLSVVVSLFLPASVYWLIALGALFLHMLCDIYGDFKILGHADNWLWVFTTPFLKVFARIGRLLTWLVMVFGAFILIAFFTLSFRIGWQLAKPDVAGTTLLLNIKTGSLSIAYIPLLALSLYHLALLTLGAAAYHKYKLEINRKGSPTAHNQINSLGYILRLFRRKAPLSHRKTEITFLKMQADQETWILICAGIIVVMLSAFTFLGWDTDLAIVLTPVFWALLFGTLVHTTVGEFGGVLGVLLAWILNLLLARLNLQPIWPIYRGYLLFGAAAGAWLLGLLGGILLKGQSRMSLIVFSLQLKNKQPNCNNDDWIKDLIAASRNSLEQGYTVAHDQLFPVKSKGLYVTQHAADLMVAPYSGNPILGTDYHHIEADDAYMPMWRELEYVLCENKLTTASATSSKLLPVMPRYRSIGKMEEGDLYWDKGIYHWKSTRRPLRMISTELSFEPLLGNGNTWLLSKTRSEVLDHLVTRRSGIHTDLFIFQPTEQRDDIVICGITRDHTSTKEYATVESEAYAGNVLEMLKHNIKDLNCIDINQVASARLFYPRLSFFDTELINWAETSAVIPSDYAGFTKNNFSTLRRSLDSLPVKNLLPSATASLPKKFLVLCFEYSIAAIISAINLDPKIATLIKNTFSALVK